MRVFGVGSLSQQLPRGSATPYAFGQQLRVAPRWPDRPYEHAERCALSQSAAKRATVARGQPGSVARDRAAPCHTGAQSAVTAMAAVHGRRRATRCAAHLQNLTAFTQDSCSAARARLAVATNRLSHRERRLERAGTSNWQEELKDGVEALNLQLQQTRDECSPQRDAFEFWCRSCKDGRTHRHRLRAAHELPHSCGGPLTRTLVPGVALHPANLS